MHKDTLYRLYREIILNSILMDVPVSPEIPIPQETVEAVHEIVEEIHKIVEKINVLGFEPIQFESLKKKNKMNEYAQNEQYEQIARNYVLVGVSTPPKIAAKVKCLNFDNTRITDDTLKKHLESFPALEKLWLGSTLITDAGLPAIKRLTKLKVLDIEYTKVTAEGFTHLQKALPRCKVHEEIAYVSRYYHKGKENE